MSTIRSIAIALAAICASATAFAQVQPELAGIVDNPCPPPLAPPPELGQALQRPDRDAVMASPPPVIAEFLKEQERRTRNDWPNLCRYKPDNAALKQAGTVPKAVFIGDSITEGWVRSDAGFFAANGISGRGISGQVSGQNLLRFEQDVIKLGPAVVHIMIGTNDVAGNAGPTTYEAIENNITAMVRLAKANGIAVILATVPPASDFPWRRGMSPAPKIQRINDWIRAFANTENLVLADYHAALSDGDGGFRKELSGDGVHPNAAGYKVMGPIAASAVEEATKR